MAASNGRAVVISIGATDLADELRTKTLAFNGDLVDVTTDDDAGWTTTLDEVFNEMNVTIQLDGILKSDTLSDMAFSGKQETMTVVVDDLFQLSGAWQFQPGFSIGAPYNDATTFSGTLQSVGVITKGAVT